MPVNQKMFSLSKEEAGILKESLVQEFIHEITKDTENSVSIINCLLEGKLTDEEISEEIELRLNIVRRVLYKLYDAGIASYKRSKDPETQWYIYNWKFDSEKAIEKISEKYRQSFKEIEEALTYEEENMFFNCVKGCRYKFEEAVEFEFICPECSSTLEYQDNSSLIDELKDKMNS
jgi:transcription initiation factor TFIIE subunit alpha